MATLIGQMVSHYKILEKLGEGGMGVVYKAHDIKLNRDVALKFLPANLPVAYEHITRFGLEAKAISALNHPHIATIYDVDEADGQKYIVLEYIPGGTLKSKLRQLTSDGKVLSIGEVLEYGIQIAGALSHAHRHQIIHRDVKTDNLMLTEEGTVKLADFGLAKLRDSVQVSKTGSTLGTPAYMSPEQIRGETIDPRSDIFSFGVVLYEMITGRLPFLAEHESAVLYRILNEEPVPVTSLRSNVPAALEGIVKKAMQKDRQHRYERVDDLLLDVKSVMRDLEAERTERRPSFSGDTCRIAVLPFANISPDPQDEYFTDGMTEELISTLSKIRGFRVIARTSVMQYKKTSKSIADIGRELKVGTLLEGSVRKAGSRLRISAQLINVDTQEHLWSDDYDRELQDVFVIQSSVAQQVALAMKVELLAGEKQQLDKGPARNLEAYTLYLKGRYCWNKFSEEGLRTSITYFGQAIDRDPTSALAYTGLAASYSVLGVNYLSPLEAFPKARAAVESALAIDAELPDARVVWGSIKVFFDWDWAAAERELKRALEINPNDATAHELYAYCMELMGRPEEALAEIQLAQEFDPLSLVINCDVGIRYYFARQYDQAIEQYQKTLEMEPDFPIAHIWLGRAYEQKGMYQEAVRAYQKQVFILSGDEKRAAALGHAYTASGLMGVLQQQLSELKQLSTQRYVPPLDIASIYARLGEHDQAFEWLQKAYDERFSLLPWLGLDPRFDSLHSDSRFLDLLKKIGLEK
jgi:serine/threonine protein kinase/Tfp pilus assembly protein PilF